MYPKVTLFHNSLIFVGVLKSNITNVISFSDQSSSEEFEEKKMSIFTVLSPVYMRVPFFF